MHDGQMWRYFKDLPQNDRYRLKKIFSEVLVGTTGKHILTSDCHLFYLCTLKMSPSQFLPLPNNASLCLVSVQWLSLILLNQFPKKCIGLTLTPLLKYYNSVMHFCFVFYIFICFPSIYLSDGISIAQTTLSKRKWGRECGKHILGSFCPKRQK